MNPSSIRKTIFPWWMQQSLSRNPDLDSLVEGLIQPLGMVYRWEDRPTMDRSFAATDLTKTVSGPHKSLEDAVAVAESDFLKFVASRKLNHPWVELEEGLSQEEPKTTIIAGDTWVRVAYLWVNPETKQMENINDKLDLSSFPE